MSLIKAIFQLNKLQNLVNRKKRIEAETLSLKEDLLKSDLVALLSSIVNEHSASVLTTTESVVDTIQMKNTVNTSPAPVVCSEDITKDVCDTKVEKPDVPVKVEVITEPVNIIEEDNAISLPLTEVIKQKMSVTILSFDEPNKVIWLQTSERMFDFPYLPEEHVGASAGDTRDLIIYEDDTYSFVNSTEQDEKAA